MNVRTSSALDDFVHGMETLVDRGADEPTIFREGGALLARLIAQDGWLPEELLEADPANYRINLLHLDPAGRFSVSAMVWGPGQGTPIHDHTVWGMVGVLRGKERCEEFAPLLEPGGPLVAGHKHDMLPGDIEFVSPRIGDIHRVSNARESNALADGTSVSIHVYGGDIASITRTRFDEDGRATPFVSPYASCLLQGRAG